MSINVLTIKNFPEFRGEIISIFERFLYDKGIEIENNDPEKLNTENVAIIFGRDFDKLENEIRFGTRDFFKTNQTTVNIDNIMNWFTKLIEEKGSKSIDEYDIHNIIQQIKDVYTSWGFKVE